jgi:molybdate transport system substrate-binding protein
MLRRTIVASVAVAALTGAIQSPGPPFLVFAAASLKTTLDTIREQWTGGSAVVSYAASSTLAKQLESGAPAELFISADEDWMDYLQQRKLIDPQTRIDLLGNTLVLIAPKDSDVALAIEPGFPLAVRLGDGHLAMGDPAAVPAGKYGKAALEALGVWSAVASRVAAAETVRAALMLVARGEAPLGIVYQTDASAEPSVRIVGTFPPDSHPPIVYPMALTLAAGLEARAFAAYLHEPAARALFEGQGFTMLDRPR